MAFCAIGRTRTRLTAGSAVKAERSDGFDVIGVNTVEGGVRDLRRPDRAVFEARGGPRARRSIIREALDEIAGAKPKSVAIDIILHDPGDPQEEE